MQERRKKKYITINCGAKRVSVVKNDIEHIYYNQDATLIDNNATSTALFIVLMEQITDDNLSLVEKYKTMKLAAGLVGRLYPVIDITESQRKQITLILCLIHSMFYTTNRCAAIIKLIEVIPEQFRRSSCVFNQLCVNALDSFASAKIALIQQHLNDATKF